MTDKKADADKADTKDDAKSASTVRIVSDTHVITDKAGSAVEPVLDDSGRKVDKDTVVNHKVGTVLEVDAKAAHDLVDRGVARKYVEPKEKKEREPARKLPKVETQESDKPGFDPQPTRASNSTDAVGAQPIAAGTQEHPATTEGPSEVHTGAGAATTGSKK